MVAKAQGAYATAQMSANDYMQTATSFAASLVSSLGGDTEKAAQYADRAIVDMADNANKMGTNIQDIQNAYQGFAKQNYTMLDNLKLGYGGTQTEMQRLIADASKMTEVQEQLGITVDSSSMSFDNIVNAIHVMQESMGIAGTSVAEAGTTIQGSLGMVKASWENLLVALADPEGNVEQAMQNFTTSIEVFWQNLKPKIQEVLKNLPKMISTLGGDIANQIPEITKDIVPYVVDGVHSITTSITNMLPDLVTAITDTSPQIIDGVTSIFNDVVDSLPQLMDNVVTAFVNLTPKLVDGVSDMAIKFTDKLPDIIQTLSDRLPEIIDTLVNSLNTLLSEKLPQIQEGMRKAGETLAKNMPSILGSLLEGIGKTMTTGLASKILELFGPAFEPVTGKIKWVVDFTNGLINNTKWGEKVKENMDDLPEAFDGLQSLIGRSFDSINSKSTETSTSISQKFQNSKTSISESFSSASENIKNKFETIKTNGSNTADNIKESMSNAWEIIKSAFSDVGSFFSNAFSTAASGIRTAWDGILSFFSGIWNGITSAFSVVGSWFSNMFTQAANGIKSAFSSIGSFFSGIWAQIKGSFNFSEMAQIGQNLIRGLGNGINATTGWLMGLVKSFCGKIVGTVKNILGIHSPSKVFRDEVGKMIVLGIAEGIEDNRTEVEKVMDSFSEDLLDIEKKYEAESKRLEDASTESSKKYLENLKETAEKERKLYDARQKDIQNLKQNILNTYKEMTTAAFDNIEDIEKLQESMADKLKDYGDLVETDITVFFNDKPLTKEVLGDLSAQTEKLKEYEKVLLDVKNRGKLPEGFFDIMRNMSVDEGLKFGKLLLNASDEEFNKYISDWQKKQETAERISKVFYRDESEAAADELVKTFSQTPKEFFDLGEDSIEAFGEGFMNNLTETMQKVAEKINITLGSLFPQVAYPEGSPLKSYADNRIINIYGSKKSTREVIEAYNQNEIYTKHTRGW